jgi:hypothetical protein
MTAIACAEGKLALAPTDSIQWSQAGGRYVRRYLTVDIDAGLVWIRDEGLRTVAEIRLDSRGKSPILTLPDTTTLALRSKSAWLDPSSGLKAVHCHAGPWARLMIDRGKAFDVEAAEDRVHLWFPDGFRLTRCVRNMQIRTVSAQGEECADPLRLSLYANPLGRSPDENERAIILGSPVYCRHSPEIPVSAFSLGLRTKALLVAVLVASGLALSHRGHTSGAFDLDSSRDALALGLGDGAVAAAALTALGDIRTYSRAVLGIQTRQKERPLKGSSLGKVG